MFINHGKIFLMFKIKNGLLFFQNPCLSEREKNIYILSKFGGTMRENTIVFRSPKKLGNQPIRWRRQIKELRIPLVPFVSRKLPVFRVSRGGNGRDKTSIGNDPIGRFSPADCRDYDSTGAQRPKAAAFRPALSLTFDRRNVAANRFINN